MRMLSESDRWGWKHVTLFGKDKNSCTNRWKCNHCNEIHSGSYSRIRAHLLGVRGEGIKSCSVINESLRDKYRTREDDRHQRKKRKKFLLGENIGKPMENYQANVTSPVSYIAKERVSCIPTEINCIAKEMVSYVPEEINCIAKETTSCIPAEINCIAKETVDETIARLFFSDGLDMNILSSSNFKEMIKAVAAFGPGYEPPSKDTLCDSFLNKEKVKLEKGITKIRESWPHTGCTMICVNCIDSSHGYLCINLFISSPRGVLFLKSIDLNERDAADDLSIDVLSNAIIEVGPTNVLQIITHLGQASMSFESIMSSEFSHIFWSKCTSHSIHLLMEEITELDWMKAVVLCAEGIERAILSFQQSSCVKFNFNETSNALFTRFAPSYCLVQKILNMKLQLQDLVMTTEWKQWKLTAPDYVVSIEIAVVVDEFWDRAELMLQLCEPYVTLLGTLNIDKSIMGDVYNWRVQSLEAVTSQDIDDIALSEIELLIDSRWDELFSPLHAAGYLLNPLYFGKCQTRDKTVMRGWKATLEKCEYDTRQLLREQLSAYLRLGGSFGDEDAVESRDKMDPVSWWENFGFETPELQNLAIRVLSQVCSVSSCQGNDLHSSLPGRETVGRMGVERTEEFEFVINNLSLLKMKTGIGTMVPARLC